MQNTVEITASARQLFNAAYRAGVALERKFEASDMTTELRQAARQYAATYSGDFGYMVEMRDAVAGNGAFLSDGQCKGVLNCLMADAKRRLAERAPKPEAAAAPAEPFLAAVPDGRYRVTLADGSDLAVRIATAGKDSRFAGSRILSTRQSGDDWMGFGNITAAGEYRAWRSASPRMTAAARVLDAAKTQDEWLVAGLAFARMGSQCFICGRDLDTPESLTAGYGPVCADKHGLPWGQVAAPAVSPAASGSSEPTPRAAEPTTSVAETRDEIDARYREENRKGRELLNSLRREDFDSDQAFFNARYISIFGKDA